MNKAKAPHEEATIADTADSPAITEQSVPKSQRIGLIFKIFKYPPTVVPIVGIGPELIQNTGANGIRIVRTPTISSLTLRPRRKLAFSVPLLSVASAALQVTIDATAM